LYAAKFLEVSLSLYKRGGIWWSRIVRHGERVDRSTKQKTKVGAQAVESRWLNAINETGELNRADVRQERPMILAEFENRFFAYLTNNVPSSNTVTFYKQAYKQLLWPGVELGTTYLSGITPAIIEEWVQRRIKEVGVARVNASLRTLRRALRLAEEWRLIRKCPKIKLLPGERHREFVISEELLTKLLAHEDCTELLRDLLPFLVDTGLRISEALALKWEHVFLEPSRGTAMIYIEKGKTKYARRHIPLTPRALATLQRLKETSKAAKVFTTARSENLTRQWVSGQFRTMRDAMKLPSDCVIHSTRHTFCTRLGESNCDAFSIQKLAGHSSIVISQRYVHPSSEVLENAISRMGQSAK
jgi:integrase